MCPKSLPTKKNKGWREAQLLIAFHKDRKGKQRQVARAWPPKDATGRIHEDPNVQETFVELRPVDDTDPPVQVKFRRDAIAISSAKDPNNRRGVIVRDDQVIVCFANKQITIDADGGMLIEEDKAATRVEADGRVQRNSELYQATMSDDGGELTRTSQNEFTALLKNGLFTKASHEETGQSDSEI